MGIFNIMANLCSVIGLFVSLFVASKVLKISNSNNNNAGKLNQGDGAQKIVENHSILADNHSSATYNDYTGAMFVGERDEPPVLSESSYLILTDEVDKYQFGVARNTSDLAMKAANTFCITADFKNMISKPDESRWIGYSIKSLPMNDWRSFINENYSLNFNYAAIGDIKEIWLEITNMKYNKKICKKKLELSSEEKEFSLQLSKYKNVIDDWKSVDEICFVFFPEDCVGQKGSVFVVNMSLQKI